QEQQLAEWFGRVPAWLITLDAEYCANCSDAEFCALVEHELYHIGQETDAFGAPAFTKDGLPKLFLRGHDVEEFVGVVRRYGIGDSNGMLAKLVSAANCTPEVARIDVAR
ncbi:putative metallopeptidase, partial [Chromohalobacter sp. HP20-39]